MIAYGFLKEILQDLFDDTSDEFHMTIRRAVNAAYFDIAADHIWHTLMENATFTGTVLPADMERNVIYIEDDTDYLQFEISETQRYLSTKLFNWYIDGSVQTPLVTGSDGVTAINDATFTSASPSRDFDATGETSLVGEFIRIGSNPGIYKIDSVTDANTLELTRKFRGADVSDPSTPAALTAQTYEIRPRGTLNIAFTNEYGDSLSSTSRKLWYQRRPLPLYNDADMLELPGTCEAVRIQAHQMLLLGLKYDNDALKQDPAFKRAIAKMKPLHPSIGRQPRPRNRFGNPIRFGRNRITQHVDANDRDIL